MFKVELKVTQIIVLVWGDSTSAVSAEPVTGFEESDGFDSFLSMTAPPPEITSRRRNSADSDEGPDFSVFIKYVICYLTFQLNQGLQNY